MGFMLGDILQSLGQAAAIILGIYMLINILVGLVFAVLFMFAFAWLGEKAELIKKLRPTVESVNAAIKSPEDKAQAAGTEPTNKLVQAVHSVQSIDIPRKIEGVRDQAQQVENKLDQGTDRVAKVMIEFRARTVQAQTIVKAFFLPGLAKSKKYRYLLHEAAMAEMEQSRLDGASESRRAEMPAQLPAGTLSRPLEEKLVEVGSAGDGSSGNAPGA